MKQLVAAILVLSVLAGCATTNLTAYVDPAFTEVQFSNTAVYVESYDLGDRQSLEYAISAQATRQGLVITPSISVMPPTRAADKLEMIQGLKALGHDAVLIVHMTDSGSTSQLIPMGNSVSQATYLHAGFNATLVGTDTHSIVWHSSADSNTDGYAGWAELLKSYAQESVKALITANLIVPQ